MSRPLSVSVITACYNSAATIGDTLRSVAEQSWPLVEHVVMDGASSDGTLALVEQFRRPGLVVCSERDHGIYDALNKGIARATGDIVCFLHADDFYPDKDVLANVAGMMAAEGLDALYGDVGFVTQDDPQTVVRRYSSARFTPARIGWGWMPAHPALFLRRAVYERYGVFKTDYKIAADYEFVARIFGNNALQAAYKPEIFVKMRLGGVSTGGWRNTLLLNREVLRACRENHIHTNWFKLLSKYPLKALEFIKR